MSHCCVYVYLYHFTLFDVISSLEVKFHQYADDTQIYLVVNKDSLSKSTLDLAGCTDAVYEWLFHNSLALNPDKSEVAMFGTAQRVGKLKQSASAAVACVQTALSDPVKIIGVQTFNSHLSFDKHVNNICRACYFHIRELRHVRSTMSADTAKIVAGVSVPDLTIATHYSQACQNPSWTNFKVSKTPSLASSLNYKGIHYTGSQGCTSYRSEPE